MNFRLTIFSSILLAVSCTADIAYDETVRIPREQMMDKIKGGWYGQAIGCAFGGPTEFRYSGGFIPDNIPMTRAYEGDPSQMPGRIHSRWRVPVVWYDEILADNMVEDPGIYDDVYMDMAFVEVMAEHGVDAPLECFAEKFAHAEFPLWCANQNARYNILQGMDPSVSGYWKNSPHADDIDFQIEADFCGLVSPAMPCRSAQVGDAIGHMLNYGDGWYGGVFVGALYSLAFVCDDMPAIVGEAAKMIPEGTEFRSCIDDVLRFWKQYPDDWHMCWLRISESHSHEIGSFDGIFNGRSISAVINSAYVAIGLLYGGGDFWKTMEIATRCGQDSDCNPATAVGVLATAKGFSAMPQEWKDAAECIKDVPFPYSEWSLGDLSEVTARLVAENLELCGGGTVTDGMYEIRVQRPEPVRYEKSFEGLVPLEKCYIREWGLFSDSLDLYFEGNSVVVAGNLAGSASQDYVAIVDAYLDGRLVETVKMPFAENSRKTEIFWKYCFGSGGHELRFVWKNPVDGLRIKAMGLIAYDYDLPAAERRRCLGHDIPSKVSVYSGGRLMQTDIFVKDGFNRLVSLVRRDEVLGETVIDVRYDLSAPLLGLNGSDREYCFSNSDLYCTGGRYREVYSRDGNGNISSVRKGTEVLSETWGASGEGKTSVSSDMEVEYEYAYGTEDDLSGFNAYLMDCDFARWYAEGLPGCPKLISGMTAGRGGFPLRRSFTVDYTEFDAMGRLLEAVRTDYTAGKTSCVRTYRLEY